jgi:hypothetical protein
VICWPNGLPISSTAARAVLSALVQKWIEFDNIDGSDQPGVVQQLHDQMRFAVRPPQSGRYPVIASRSLFQTEVRPHVGAPLAIS